MFEQSSAEMPPSSIWASMNSWFTPAVFFVLLNVMIGTIAFTSTLANKKQNQPKNRDQRQNEESHAQPKPSVLQRLKSTRFNPYFNISQDPKNLSVYEQSSDTFSLEQPHYFFQENLQLSQAQTTNYIFEQTHDQKHQESQTHFVFEQKYPDLGDSKPTHLDFEDKDREVNGSKQAHRSLDAFEQGQEEKIKEFDSVEQTMDNVSSQVASNHFIRTKSDTEPTSGEIPVKLSARIRKSASLKSPFGHFEEEKIMEALRVENSGTAEGDDEVDARADDFINKFKQQLKLQRSDSIIRYKDMIGRGRAAGR